MPLPAQVVGKTEVGLQRPACPCPHIHCVTLSRPLAGPGQVSFRWLRRLPQGSTCSSGEFCFCRGPRAWSRPELVVSGWGRQSETPAGPRKYTLLTRVKVLPGRKRDQEIHQNKGIDMSLQRRAGCPEVSVARTATARGKGWRF
jgi:hypothetical protein